MQETHNQHGGRGASGSSRVSWWAKYRAWVAGLDKGARIRYRVFQVLAAAAVLVIALLLFLRSWIKLPDPPPPPDVGPKPGSSASQSQPDLTYEDAELPEVTKSGRKEGYYTFLVAGQDSVSGATDTMLLFTYDTAEHRVSAISLLRDTMINTTAGSKRLNTVYARNRGSRELSEKERTANGMAALRQEVSKLTGIYPDFYVLVQWEAIGRLVDAIGGVEFEVPFDMNYDDDTPGQDLHIHQKAGLRLLNGQDAMEVIRFRKNSDGTHILGDAGRTQIQRDFLTAVLKECLTPEILLKLPALAQIFMDNVITDLTLGNILAFAQLAVGMDAEKDVNFFSMPYDNVWYRGASMAVARQDELLEVLNSGLNPYLDEIRASDLQLIYQKRGGGYGVTNAVLADPAMGRAPAAVQPEKPKEPDPPIQSDSPDQSGQPEPPDQSSAGDGTEAPPDGEAEPEPPGDSSQTGTVTIDPSDIFPDSSAGVGSSGSTQPEQGEQAA